MPLHFSADFSQNRPLWPSSATFRADFVKQSVKVETAYVIPPAAGAIQDPSGPRVDAGQGQILDPVAYPIPFSDDFTLRIQSVSTAAMDISLFDMNGRLAYSYRLPEAQIGEQEVELQPGDIATGAYHLLIEQEGQPARRLRLVKQ